MARVRAAIYARYSSENQREASIEDQIRQSRAFIDRQSWSIERTYQDAAISGATMLRPGCQQMLQDAQQERFDVVVTEALDRLSRDQEDVAAIFKRLTFAGVQIVTLAEGEITELHVGLKGTMNALYLKDLARKTWRGLEGRVRSGRSGGGLCFGYDVVDDRDDGGERIRGGRQVNPAEAETVRQIFHRFAAGCSPRAIARDLNAGGVPGPGGRPWRDTTIRGHGSRGTGILNNELYIGRLVWNRQRYVKDPETGRRLARPNPSEVWIIEEVPQLRIVDDELWKAVKKRQITITASPAVQKIKKSEFWKKRRARHLLTGLITCAICGGRFAAVGRHYLACGNARQTGTCNSRRSIPREVLEDLILTAMRERLLEPDCVQEFVAAYQKTANERERQREVQLGVVQRELSEVTRKLEGLIDAIADGLRTDGLVQRLETLEQRRADLEVQLKATPAPAPRLHPGLADAYRDKVAALRASLGNPTIRQEALELLRGLIERIEMHPVRDGFRIVLTGAIARMVRLAAEDGNDKKKAAWDEAACSEKVVAGARNHREFTVSVPV